MPKLRYEFDPHNRLVVIEPGLHGLRRVLEGNFKIAEHNSLTYHIKAPVPCDIKAAHQVKLKGTWSLTDDHELRLTLDKWYRKTFGDELTICGEIIGLEKNSLLFQATTRTKGARTSLYILELAGSWQADKHNRLAFRVNKEQGSFDVLTFAGTWQIDEKYQVIYRYQKESLARKQKEIHLLTFKGYWDIKEKARLSYVLDKNTGSGFDFKTGLGIFKDGYIKYELGSGLSRKSAPIRHSIVFFGKWKIEEERGLVFEVENAGKKIQALTFGAEAKLTDRGRVLFNLKSNSNREIGAELELSRDIFKGEGQAFLRLLESRHAPAFLLGAGFRW